MVQDEVLTKVDGTDVEAFVVWIPTFPGDDRDKALAARNLVPDSRVRHFWDGDRGLGKRYHSTLGLPEHVGVAWDVYFVFGGDASWAESAPMPVEWQHQLSGVNAARRLDGPSLHSTVDRLLRQ